MGRWFLIIAVLFTISVFATPLLFGGGNDDEGLERRASGWFLEDLSGTTAVTVERVTDGDTLDVVLFGGEPLRVRLFGVNAPEQGETCADAATSRLRTLASARVLLLPDERLEDPGGRQLRCVFTPDGRSIDAALIDDGLATAWREDGAYRDQLVDIEEDARDARRGCLWEGAD